MSDAVNLLVYVHGSSSAAMGVAAPVAASCADEFSGNEGEWLARQRGAVGESYLFHAPSGDQART
jgi:hypothetical protein